MNAEQSRKAMFAACRQLGMDDADRKAMMLAVTGKASSGQFNPLDWARVLDHLNKRTGYDSGRKPNKPAPDKAALMGKIEAQLADMGLPWHYLTSAKHGKSMCQRLAGVDAMEFATPAGLSKIVAALAYRQKRLAPSPACGGGPGRG